jgi:hypothetical protein
MDILDLKVFYDLIGTGKIKTSYVNATNDIALPLVNTAGSRGTPSASAAVPNPANRGRPLCHDDPPRGTRQHPHPGGT